MEAIVKNNQYNTGYLCTKLQCQREHSDKIAMRRIASDLRYVDYRFKDLETQSKIILGKFAGGLNFKSQLGLVKAVDLFSV